MTQLVVTVYAILTLMLLVVRLERGLLFLLPLLPVAAYTYRSPITGLNTVNILIYTAFGMALIRSMGRSSKGLPPSTLPLASFFILTMVAWIVGVINFRSDPVYDPIRMFINFERWVVYTLLYFAFYLGWSGRYSIQTGFRWMLVGVLIAAASNVTEIINPGEYYLLTGRTGAIFKQANSNGIFLASYGFLGLVLAYSARTKMARWAYFGTFALCIQGILLSVSRTGLLSFMVAGLGYAYFRSRKMFVAGLFLVAMLVPTYSLILPDKIVERLQSTVGESRYEGVAGKFESSTANRLVQNVAGIRLFLDSPILGHGLGGFYFRSPKYLPPNAPDVARAPHTSFLWILVNMGSVAMACFLWFLWSIAREGLRLYRSNEEEPLRLLGLFLVVSMLSKTAANFVSTDFLTGDVSSYLWIAGALIAWQNHHASEKPVVVKEEQREILPGWRPRARAPAGSGADHG